jgi:cytochrome P450
MTKAAFPVELFGIDYFQDPHSVHERLRVECPVGAVVLPGGTPAWLVTRYAEARTALSDPRLRKTPPGGPSWTNSMFAPLEAHMLNSDPPKHDRLRQLVSRAFAARRVELLRPRITAITAGLLDNVSIRCEVDLLASVAIPLAMSVICEVLGVPVVDRDQLLAWSASLDCNNAVPGVFSGEAATLIGYFRALLSAKRRESSDDLLSELLAAHSGEGMLDETELVAMAFLLLVAGYETTVNLIGNGILALLLNPLEMSQLRADSRLLHSGVEELLRYGNPVNSATFRYADESMEIGGAHLGRGEIVVVALSSANRDPSRYRHPDRLDVRRDSSGHLAFGHGVHYCLGAPLARLEGEIVFKELISRFRSIRLAVPVGSLRWRPSAHIHGLEELPVRLVA